MRTFSLLEMFISTHFDFLSCLCFQLISFKDPGPHGSGRYSPEMYPEIDERDFRKGAQVQLFSILIC